MPSWTTEVLLLFLLIVANGVFAMSEIAIISARRMRLEQRAAEGDRGAQVALSLSETPNRFLSTVQIGITLIGILAGALGGATLAMPLADLLRRVEFLAPYANGLAVTIVVIAITYLSLIIGELVPKRLALNNPEGIARVVSRPMRFVAKVASPLVRLLSASTELVLRILGIRLMPEPPVTEEEIRGLFAQGTEAGVFEQVEQQLVEQVLLLNDRRVSALMTPRPEMMWLNQEAPVEEVMRTIIESPYSRFPVARGSLDDVVGEVHTKDILTSMLSGNPFDLTSSIQTPLYVPEVMPALQALEAFKQSGRPTALVIDEYGSVTGYVTLTDILEAIVGDIPSADGDEEPEIVQREDGTWLVDGMLPIGEFRELFALEELPGEEQGLYQTLAGFVTSYIGRIPEPADHFSMGGLRFEVVDMDGNRVDKVLVARAPHPSPESEEPEEADAG
ncbi:MAG TPA: HlyC/CorC family transporter [Chloroflexi bacterium]|jgi:putative hemolysin|nr:HlyC/CorC family transporter [Chloroflexota bacterium]